MEGIKISEILFIMINIIKGILVLEKFQINYIELKLKKE